MAKVNPNQKCPCGSEIKFKKCCKPFIEGVLPIENAERLLQSRYTAFVNQSIQFLWDTEHPESSRKLNERFSRYQKDCELTKDLDFKKLTIVDVKEISNLKAIIVFYVEVYDGHVDVSFIEESEFSVFEGKWYYYDGLRRSINRIGCQPESVKVGELKHLYLHESQLN